MQTDGIVQRPSRQKLTGFGIIFGCLFSFLAFYYYFTAWPQYLILDIAEPQGRLWMNTEKTVQVWNDSGSKFYIWRQEGFISTYKNEKYQDWDSIIRYFDKWLIAHGWQRAENDGDTPCNVFMPESEFLDIGTNGYVVYKRPGSKTFHWVPTVCLAVWPSDENHFNIVLLTAKPSPATAISSEFE